MPRCGRWSFALLIPLLILPLYGWWEWSATQVEDFDPATASSRELFLGMCGFDVSERAPEFQRALFTRCRSELSAKSDDTAWTEIRDGLARLGESRREVWRVNVDWYCRAWWRAEATAFRSIPQDERTVYVRTRLREIAVAEARILERLWRTTESAKVGDQDFAGKLSAAVESWIATAESTDQTIMREFWNQLRFQLLIDPELRTLFPTGARG